MKKLKGIIAGELILMLILLVLTFHAHASGDGNEESKKKSKSRIHVSSNHVTSGENVQIQYFLEKDTELFIIITDEQGQTNFFISETFKKGDNNLVLSTKGLQPGKYTISLNAEGLADKIPLEILK